MNKDAHYDLPIDLIQGIKIDDKGLKVITTKTIDLILKNIINPLFSYLQSHRMFPDIQLYVY